MTARPIIDAGPALNFLAINRERIITSVLGKISVPGTVESEILDKARRDPRFRAVPDVWGRMRPNWIDILSDDETPELNAAVVRMSKLPIAERKMHAKDLGEVMVVAHAAVQAEAGADVIVIIDDQAGARLATGEKRRLDRLRGSGHPVGSIVLVNTTTILLRAAAGPHIPDATTMREVYARLRSCDDGLLPIEQTRLLDRWR